MTQVELLQQELEALYELRAPVYEKLSEINAAITRKAHQLSALKHALKLQADNVGQDCQLSQATESSS